MQNKVHVHVLCGYDSFQTSYIYFEKLNNVLNPMK